MKEGEKMDTTKSTIGQRIRALREDNDIGTQTALAAVLNSQSNGESYEQRTISKIEKDERKLLADEVLPFAAALQTDPLFLLSGIHNENFTVAADLGLSDSTITELKKAKEAAEKQPIVSVNPLAALVQVLAHDKALTVDLFNYFFQDFSYLLVRKTHAHNMPDLIEPEYVQNVQMTDFEPVARLALIDSLSRCRDRLTGERSQIIYENSKTLRNALKNLPELKPKKSGKDE